MRAIRWSSKEHAVKRPRLALEERLRLALEERPRLALEEYPRLVLKGSAPAPASTR